MNINYEHLYKKYKNKYLKLKIQQGGYLPTTCIKDEPVCLSGNQGTQYDEYKARVYANTSCNGEPNGKVYLDDGTVIPNSTIKNFFHVTKCNKKNTALWSTLQKDTISVYIDKKGIIFNLDAQLIHKKDANKKYRIDKISITGLVNNITSATIEASNINNPNDKVKLSTDDVKKDYYIIKPYDSDTYKSPTDIVDNVDVEFMQNHIAKKIH